MDAEYLQERISAVKASIANYEAAIDAITLRGAQHYSLDTGQNRQTVTRADLRQLEISLSGLYNRLEVLEARLNGGGGIVRPAW